LIFIKFAKCREKGKNAGNYGRLFLVQKGAAF
jgi:hypothetical protein